MMNVREKFQKQDEHISEYVYEREKHLHFLNLAILAKQHMMMLGVPGISKSELARYKFAYLGGNMFYNNCHSYTVPSELLGLNIVDKIKQGILEYNIEKMLPWCEWAIVDEVFKVAKALSSMLPILNERKFKNGQNEIDVPLNTAVLISNELPTDPEVKGAFFDRCPIRFEVEPIADDDNLIKLVKKSFMPKFSVKQDVFVTLAELEQAQKEVSAIVFPDESIGIMRDIFRAVNSQAIYVSDRQFFQFVSIAKAEAYMNGKPEVEPDHLHILTESMWHEPKQRKVIAKTVNEFVNTNIIAINEKFDVACAEYDSWKQQAQSANHKEFSGKMSVLKTDFENMPVRDVNKKEHSILLGKLRMMHNEISKYALQQMKLGR